MHSVLSRPLRRLSTDPASSVSPVTAHSALTTCRSEVSAHAVVAFLEARLDEGAPGNVTEAS